MVRIALGRPVCLRVGRTVIETIDSVRLDHVLRFARGTGKDWPMLERAAQHPDAGIELDSAALVDELQRLALERPPEDVAPLIGLLRNDAVRVANMAAHG